MQENCVSGLGKFSVKRMTRKSNIEIKENNLDNSEEMIIDNDDGAGSG